MVPVGHGALDDGDYVDFNLQISLTEPLGTETILFTEIAGVDIQAKMLNPRPVESGEILSFKLSLDKFHVFYSKSGVAIRG
ncbi:MAG: hypothetical protein HRU28_19170 [Rhizobiales bacterium]|nr:hypothetical protein [Hyphomicrobiales bacterium]